MKCKIRVLPLWTKLQPTPQRRFVSTVAKSAEAWERDLSPFILGPCDLYGRYSSRNMENGWQYSKVYTEHLNDRGGVSKEWWRWAKHGWNETRAVRYPMGKGAVPEFSYWDGHHLGYIEARKVIYGPLYAKAVIDTKAYRNLRSMRAHYDELVLLDYDAYDHYELGMTLTDVLNNPKKKMGHAFVLAMLLMEDDALNEFSY